MSKVEAKNHPTIKRIMLAKPEHIKAIQDRLMNAFTDANEKAGDIGITGWKESIPVMDTNPSLLWDSGALSAVQGLLSTLIIKELDKLEAE
jgi:hypothetical protein